MILAFDTATRAFTLALYRDGTVAKVEFLHEIARSQDIVSVVDFMLTKVRFSLKDLQAVYAGIGPGSFTGIRIGLAFANTVLQTAGIPLLGIPTLDLLAFECEGWYNSAISYVKSRKGEVYTAFYRGNSRISEYLALRKEDFLRFIEENGPSCLIGAEDEYRELGLESACPSGVRPLFGFPKAENAFPLARERGLNPQRRYLKPMYLRDSYAVPRSHR